MASVSATSFASFPWATSSRADEWLAAAHSPARFLRSHLQMRPDPAPAPVSLIRFSAPASGRALRFSPKRSLGSRSTSLSVIEMGADLYCGSLSHVAALQNFQHNLPLLPGFSGLSLSRISLPGGGPQAN